MDIWALLAGGIGALIGAAIKHGFQVRSDRIALRREVVESHLLQLQNALESLYYRINNILDHHGRSVMDDDYYWRTTAYIVARVLAHEMLLVSDGIYAQLAYDEALRRPLKHGLHTINWMLDDQRFLHYHRVELAELAIEDVTRLATYSEFLAKLDQESSAALTARAKAAMEALPPARLESLRTESRRLVHLLESETGVPSALTLERES